MKKVKGNWVDNVFYSEVFIKKHFMNTIDRMILSNTEFPATYGCDDDYEEESKMIRSADPRHTDFYDFPCDSEPYDE